MKPTDSAGRESLRPKGLGALRRIREEELYRLARERLAQSQAQIPVDPALKVAPTSARERIAREGFAVVRDLIPARLVDAVRERVYSAFIRGGLRRASGRDPSIFTLARAPAELIKFSTRDFVTPVVTSPSFAALINHVAAALRPVTGPSWPIQADHGRWLRMGLPHGLNRRMPPHQDIYYLPGAEKFVTVWVPLHRCPRALGSLRVVPRSHRFGAFFHDGRNGIPVKGTSLRWRQFDMEVGDAIVFHRHMVHAAGLNRTEAQARFSFDFRLAKLD